jgi:cytochrome P450
MLAASPANDEKSRQALRDQVITIFLAGYETVANAMSWTWYLLSQNPESELRFHEELGHVIPDGQPMFEHVPRLRFTENVLAESLRLFPPAWAMGRYAPQRFFAWRFFSSPPHHRAHQPVRHSP